MSIQDIFDMIVAARIKKYNGIVAQVKTVDTVKKTCDVQTLEGASIFDVRLIANNGSDGLIIKPSIDSFVVVHMISDNDYYVTQFSNFDEIDLGDGSYGGMTIIATLVTKLNNLENKVNSIISTFNSHVHTGVTTGGGSSGTTVTPVAGSLTPTNQTELENTKVKHGI